MPRMTSVPLFSRPYRDNARGRPALEFPLPTADERLLRSESPLRPIPARHQASPLLTSMNAHLTAVCTAIWRAPRSACGTPEGMFGVLGCSVAFG